MESRKNTSRIRRGERKGSRKTLGGKRGEDDGGRRETRGEGAGKN